MKKTLHHLAKLAHRWSGILLGIVIIVAGLTGTVLAFEQEVDNWLNADIHRRVQGGPPLSLSTLQAAVERQYPHAQVRRMRLDDGPGYAMFIELEARSELTKLPANQIWIDPANGAVLGERLWGAPRVDRRHIVPFLYRLHRTLLLDDLGKTITGVIAFVWLLSTAIGIWLAWPNQGKWRQALSVKSGASGFRAQYDLHRAVGLWTAPAFLVIAFSAVYFNLDFIVRPMINAVSPTMKPPTKGLKSIATAEVVVQPEQAVDLALNKYPDGTPWRILFDRKHGLYRVDLHRPGDRSHAAETRLFIDMRAPRIAGSIAPETRSAGDTFQAWQFPLHSGQFLGIAGQILWALFGLVPVLMMVTGITVWLKKRKSERVATMRRRVAGLA